MNRIFNNIKRQLTKALSIASGVAFLWAALPLSVEAAEKRDQHVTIVLDAGHGGHDHGAIDNGAREKDINLGVAKKLASMLKKKMKNVKVVMTRDDDTFISLQERANIANRNKADLFVSIHTNSVDKSNTNRTKVSGASVYALGPQKDANNLQVAQRENSVIELEDNYHQKYSGFDPSKDESYIIFEMAQKKTMGKSLKFADKAQKELVKTAGRNDRGVKQAGFWVLWATSMPSVLVELDFICNPDEAKFLTSNDGQEKLATALYNAIESYFNGSESKAAIAENQIQQVETIETVAVGVSETVDDNDDRISDGGVLYSSSETREKSRNEHVAQTVNHNRGPRKRRSASSKQISIQRDVETSDIQLKQETVYLVKNEEKPEIKEEKPILADNNAVNSKNKRQNNKVKKEKKTEPKKQENKIESDKQMSASSSSRSTKKAGRKTIVVKSTSEVLADNKLKDNRNNEIITTEQKTPRPITPVPSQTNTSVNTVYKILLLSSEKELSANDPVFAGFKPTGMYKENNQFKYTYGSSTNRREIETQLLQIKSYLPDAIIVVRAD